jgi:hypothetical protein
MKYRNDAGLKFEHQTDDSMYRQQSFVFAGVAIITGVLLIVLLGRVF